MCESSLLCRRQPQCFALFRLLVLEKLVFLYGLCSHDHLDRIGRAALPDQKREIRAPGPTFKAFTAAALV